MHKFINIILFILLFTSGFAQSVIDNKENDKKLIKENRIQDRAGGTHNASNIGLFFENRGKLYPRTVAQGPSGEYPINSGKNYIFRINPLVGVPGNVVQGRFTTSEEWEAAYGYHNSDTARISFSTDPNSWPKTGWPVKDNNGGNIILSDQDSYTVYNDSGNTKSILGVKVAQTGYAFGTKFAKNILFFKYEITNNGSEDLDSLFFGLYCDIDVGNISGGTPEWSDDKVGFNKSKNLLYFYDDGLSAEWPDGKTGYFGIAFLKTPQINGVEAGITDMHYSVYNDDAVLEIDTVYYGVMSSAQSLFSSSLGNKFFHLGGNSNLHFDNMSTIPSEGLDILANISSGPYTIKKGETITFVTALIGGESLADLEATTGVAQSTVSVDFKMPKPPVRPLVMGESGDGKAVVYWNDNAELSYDEFSGYDFEGYRIYRSNDKGKSWTKLADYDLINTTGSNTGLAYSYIDTTIVNGFEYWYSVTSYDRGTQSVESLESPLGNTLDAVNTVQIIPRSNALGREPVSVTDIKNLQTGTSNYQLNANVVDEESLAGGSYKTTFTYTPRIEKGTAHTVVTLSIVDSTKTKPYKYGIEFATNNTVDLKNITTNTIIRGGYSYPSGGRDLLISDDGIKISLRDLPGTPSEFLPKAGDLITVGYAMNLVKGSSDTIIKARPYQVGQTIATSEGMFLTMKEPEAISSISRVGGTDNVDVAFKVLYPDSIKTSTYVVSVDQSGMLNNSGYTVVSVSGTAVTADTLFTGETFYFDGVEGTITFPVNKPPKAGNKFSLQTVKKIPLTIKDSYSLSIKGSVNNKTTALNNLNKIRVVPNPYVVSSLYEPEYGELRREPLRQIQFTNLPSSCSIYIFSSAGDMVKTINHESTTGTEVWDLKSDGGREIAPGVYIYVVKTKDFEYKNLFSIIK